MCEKTGGMTNQILVLPAAFHYDLAIIGARLLALGARLFVFLGYTAWGRLGWQIRRRAPRFAC